MNRKWILVTALLLLLAMPAAHAYAQLRTARLPPCFFSSDWNTYQRCVLSQQTRIPGWCTVQKAKNMMDLAYEVKPDVCVEVGVFGGSSIYPTACTLRFLNKGKIYAIDSWSVADCLEGYAEDDPNYAWWKALDYEAIYAQFCAMLKYYQLDPYSEVMRMTGIAAASYFEDESIDILHIDGNHTQSAVLADAQAYLPKVKTGGYIWFDDVNWHTSRDGFTTRAAYDYLIDYCELVVERSENDYCLFRKR